MSTFAKDLLEALADALEHAKGQKSGVKTHHFAVQPVDVRATRRKLKLSQAHMAMLLGVSVSGYRKWEQGERQPGGAARTLLTVMARDPEAVLKAIAH